MEMDEQFHAPSKSPLILTSPPRDTLAAPNRHRQATGRRTTHRTIMVLKRFFKRLCGSTSIHDLLKNHFFLFETPL